MKRPILLFAVGLIIIIVGAQYFNINICTPFKLQKIYSTVLNCQITGTIIDEQKESDYNYNYIVNVKKLYSNGELHTELTDTNVLVKVKKKDGNRLQIGNVICFTCEIEDTICKRNYGGYDYNIYLKSLKVLATTKTERSNIQVVGEEKLSFIQTLKIEIVNKVNKILSVENKGLCLGILLGDTKYITDDINQNFKDSNLSHMLAVSGAHISYIVIGITKCLKKVDKKMQNYILIIFLLFFIKLTGSTSSVMRAGIMAILSILANLLHKKSDTINNIGISCIIILCINPYNFYNLGFQLSYLGTLGIILFYDIVKVKLVKLKTDNVLLNYVLNTTCVSISANILIMPIMIYYYNKISFTFIVSNILVSFLFQIIIFLSISTVTLSFISINLGQFISPVLNSFLRILNICVEFSAKFSVFDILVPTPTIIEVILMYVIIFILRKICIAPNSKKYKKILKIFIIFYLVIVLILYFLNNNRNSMKLFFVDVGQGDCTLIITQENKKILIDGGGSNTEYDVGKQVLLPYLLDRGIMKIDFILISHFDSDHCKGIFTVMENLKIENILVSSYGQSSDNYNQFLKLAKIRNINIIWVKPGDKFKIDKYTYLDILWTGSEKILENVINNASIMCRVIYKDKKILFTGDIEAIAEDEILNLHQNIDCDVLKVAHHGSKSSSTLDFVSTVSPEIALIGVGKNNNFGHPNSGVIDRLQESGAKIFRTDLDGEIVININKNGRFNITKCIN